MRSVKLHSINFMQGSMWTVDLMDGEVARLVSATFNTGGSSSWGSWNILLMVGPPETVDEMAKAMERTLKSAP